MMISIRCEMWNVKIYNVMCDIFLYMFWLQRDSPLREGRDVDGWNYGPQTAVSTLVKQTK